MKKLVGGCISVMIFIIVLPVGFFGAYFFFDWLHMLIKWHSIDVSPK